MRAQLRDFPSESVHALTHVYYTPFPLYKYFICFTTFLSLWKFFSAKMKGQGPCHWPVVWWLESGAFTAVTQPNIWLGTQGLLETTAGWWPPKIGSNLFGVYMLVGSIPAHGGGFSTCKIVQSYCCVYPLRGNQDPAPRLICCFSWLLLPCLAFHPFPN